MFRQRHRYRIVIAEIDQISNLFWFCWVNICYGVYKE
jgi:hypothetical protein